MARPPRNSGTGVANKKINSQICKNNTNRIYTMKKLMIVISVLLLSAGMASGQSFL